MRSHNAKSLISDKFIGVVEGTDIISVQNTFPSRECAYAKIQRKEESKQKQNQKETEQRRAGRRDTGRGMRRIESKKTRN